MGFKSKSKLVQAKTSKDVWGSEYVKMEKPLKKSAKEDNMMINDDNKVSDIQGKASEKNINCYSGSDLPPKDADKSNVELKGKREVYEDVASYDNQSFELLNENSLVNEVDRDETSSVHTEMYETSLRTQDMFYSCEMQSVKDKEKVESARQREVDEKVVRKSSELDGNPLPTVVQVLTAFFS